MLRWPLTLVVIAGLAACDSGKNPPPVGSAPKVETSTPPGDGPAPGTVPPTPPPVPQASSNRSQDPVTEPPPRREDLFPHTPEFIVKPIDGEPAWPSPADDKEVTKRGFLPFKGGYQYELFDDGGKLAQAGVVVDGRILLDHGVVELLGCGEQGKEHESILRLEADVQGLDLALNLCGLKRGPIPGRLADPEVMQGSRVLVFLQWEDADRKTVTHRAEDCVVHLGRKAPMPRVGWTYVGAMLPVPDPASTSGKTYRVLAAAGTRSLLTTYRDPTTLLDNPLYDAVDDSLYMANYMILPEMGTKVRVILRPPGEAEKKEIAKIEAELMK